jgi:hypothetical protein
MHAFGPQQPLGKHPGRNAVMSASVVVPGLAAGRTEKDNSNNKSGASQAKKEHAYEGPMSVIQDCETANEQDTVQEENVGSDEENAQQRDPRQDKDKNEENVSDSNDPPDLNLGKSILSQEE